jgi:hypothetical protein
MNEIAHCIALVSFLVILFTVMKYFLKIAILTNQKISQPCVRDLAMLSGLPKVCHEPYLGIDTQYTRHFAYIHIPNDYILSTF